MFNQVRPDDGQVNMLTGDGGIPGVHMRRVDAIGEDGVLAPSEPTPAPGTAGPTLSIGQEHDGWGYAHLFDAKTGEELDAYAIPESQDARFASGFGDLSIHEFATDSSTNLAYSAYYGGGMRVFRFSRTAGLEPMGAWIAPGGGGSNFWGVEQYTAPNGEHLIAGSDRDFGLKILRYTGPGAVGPTPAAPAPGGGGARRLRRAAAGRRLRRWSRRPPCGSGRSRSARTGASRSRSTARRRRAPVAPASCGSNAAAGTWPRSPSR